MLWQGATAGEVTFHASNREWGGSRTFEFKAADWFELAKWLYSQIDGELSMTFTDDGSEGDKPPSDDDLVKPQIYLPSNGREAQAEQET